MVICIVIYKFMHGMDSLLDIIIKCCCIYKEKKDKIVLVFYLKIAS